MEKTVKATFPHAESPQKPLGLVGNPKPGSKLPLARSESQASHSAYGKPLRRREVWLVRRWKG